jgi:predicted DNA-binding transcriptional regulator YafY
MVKPWFDISDSKLASRKTRSARWQEKILVVPPGLPRQTPHIDPDVQSGVTQSLLEEVPILINYKSRQAKSPRWHVVSPLGLVMRERISYLIAYMHEKETVSQFAMHRIVSMDWDEEEPEYERPKGFNLKQYAEEGNLAILKGQARELELELWLNAQAAIGVRECPVHKKQTLTCTDEEGYILKAKVPNTLELRRWIYSLGVQVEVLKPVWLRQEMADEVTTIAGRYSRAC